MSDDIVKRLREPVLMDVHPVSLHAKTMREAADEIERLRAELAAVRKAKMERLQTAADTIQEQRTENDALRELLREATGKLQPIGALVDMTPSGFPDHDICPIRLGMARDLRELHARIKELEMAMEKDDGSLEGGEDE